MYTYVYTELLTSYIYIHIYIYKCTRIEHKYVLLLLSKCRAGSI